MSKRYLVFVSAFVLIPYVSNAANSYTRGLYGKLEYVLMNDKIEDKYNSTERKSFIQNYELGYESYLYSPLLLTYDIGTSFYVDDTTSTTKSETSTTKSENNIKHTNYKAYLHFIKRSNYPFTIYKEKIDSPLWSTQADTATLVTYKTDKQGIFGRLKLKYFDLNYEVRDTETEKTESFAYETGNTRRYSLGISKQFDMNKTASFNYSHQTRDYYRTDTGLGYTDQWNDVVDNATANFSWRMSETMNMRTFASYLKNSYFELEDLSGSINFNYHPNEKLSASTSLTANNMKTKDGTNNYITFNENSTYRVTENFSTNQNLQIFNASGDTSNMTLTSLTLGSNYIKKFSKSMTGTLNASVTGRMEKFGDDGNSTISDRNMLSYTLGSGITKNFEESRSSLSANISYYQLISTTSDSTRRITLNAGYNKKFSEKLSYYLKMYATRDENTYTNNNETTERTTNILSIDNAVNYWTLVGYNGKLTSKAGVTYSSGTFTNRVNPYANATFMYMIRRNLMFKAVGRVSSDTAYDIVTYSGTADMTYRIRKIQIRVGTQLSSQTGGSFGERTHTNYYFRISRTL
ncbi:hypothetical protein [Nitrosophilus alvini]|uniref:hypothetical protein n=1 Tax=Nitrosophilus alvini TaxID=2714855 RepID=UPI00190C2B38|nr:hypothetical protein [Nitrosophilus alvini]